MQGISPLYFGIIVSWQKGEVYSEKARVVLHSIKCSSAHGFEGPRDHLASTCEAATRVERDTQGKLQF